VIHFFGSHEETKRLPKLVVLLGPTACGKTEWSIPLAKKIRGEVISADSRQIYKKMDIGTAKPHGEWRRNGLRRTFFVEDVPHHLIDFLDPGKSFSVAEFRDKALKYAKLAHMDGKVPFIVGGTGLYISSIVDNLNIPRVPANPKLRKSLEGKKNEELLELLRRLDPVTGFSIDQQNKRRVIRALEVCIFTGEPFSAQKKRGEALFHTIQIGIQVDRHELYARIDDRIDMMMKLGLFKEVEALTRQRYGWNLPSMNGIGYRQFRPYFEKQCSLDDVIHILKSDTKHYARRQLTWFRRDKRIAWCASYEDAEKKVQEFLSS